MGRLFFALGLYLVFGLAGAAPASAYTPTISPNGAIVQWKGHPKLNLAGNPLNLSGLSETGFFSAAVHGLQRWKAASSGALDFDYWQGTRSAVYPPVSKYDGLSTLYFLTNSADSADTSRLSPNVLGLTQVWYKTETGEILETDIILNDRDFRFTTDPRDTSGYGSGGSNSYGGKSRVFIENVITHELGHAFGLSHAAGLQSTMLFMESPEQAHLSCDDAVAIHALYPSAESAARGTITGKVVTDSGKPVFGAHVVAISRQRGTVLATALSDRAGNYSIAALEPGEYFLMVEPFFAGGQALPAYYSGISSQVCPGGQSFGRTFLLEGSGMRLQGISVSAGSAAGAPALVARCGATGGAAVAALSSLMSTVPVIYDATTDGSGFGVVDRSASTRESEYRLQSVSGRLELHVLSYSLYSPVRPTLTLMDEKGYVVETGTTSRAYVGESGFVNYDSVLVAEGLRPGDYVLRVELSNLNAAYYPAGPVMLDSVPFLAITGSMNEAPPALARTIPLNGRCRMNENFAAYASPPGDPVRGQGGQSGEESTGFCGTVARSGGGSGNGGSGPGPGALAGWLLPWVAMGLWGRRARALAHRELRG